MNYLSGLPILVGLLVCSACGASTAESQSANSDSYALHYSVTIDPENAVATVNLALKQTQGQLRHLSFDADNLQMLTESSNNNWSISDSRVVWDPPADGGNLSWTVDIGHRRGGNGFDAYLNSSWGIFRAEDIIPRARTRSLKGARSQTTMHFDLPANWSAVSEYAAIDDQFVIDNPSRRFDQPTGWIAVGDLGVRRETIAGTRVAIVGPKGQSVRRMDMLALLNWALPELNAVLAEPIPRLTVVSADDPMWRGGLSAPASIFIHSDRPLISENATSTLIHEVMHVALRINASREYDWITEGLAEYYSLELLQRSGAITSRRYSEALRDQEQWAKQATHLCGSQSSGANTALAVTLFRQLDLEIRAMSDGRSSLDDTVITLINSDAEVNLSTLRQAVTQQIDRESKTLFTDNLLGCSKIATVPKPPAN